MNNQYKKNQGFTLIEMMVVITILGILAALAYPKYTDHIEKGELADAKQSALALRQSLEATRLSQPREFMNRDGFNKQIQRAITQIDGSSAKAYTFEHQIVTAQNGIPTGFTMTVKPKASSKKYMLKMDANGNFQKCLRKKTNDCESY